MKYLYFQVKILDFGLKVTKKPLKNIDFCLIYAKNSNIWDFLPIPNLLINLDICEKFNEIFEF